MPLIHEFLIAPKIGFELNQIVRNNNGRINKSKSGIDYLVELDDEFFQYFSDTLKWIPNETGNRFGLNYYGLTDIYPNGASVLKKIITGWYEIFENAPNEIKLTGNYFWRDQIDKGEYEKIEVRKANLLKILSELITLCNLVEGNDDLIILHLGI